MQRRNNIPQGKFMSAPAQFNVRQPQSRSTDDDTEDTTTGVMLRSRDNFDRVASMARDAYNIGKELLGELNVEDKIYTTNNFATTFAGAEYRQPDYANNTPHVFLNEVPQNVKEAGRTGDSIEMKGTKLTGRIVRNVETYSVNYVRIYIMYYYAARPASQSNFPASVDAGDGIWDFELKSSSLAPKAQKDYDSKVRSKIVWEKTFKVTHDNSEILFDDWIKLRGKHVQFENDASGSGSINTGALTIGIVSDVPASSGLQVYWHNRLYFVDN